MSKMELHGLEEKIYRSYWEDGLVDVFAGTMIILIGISWLIDLVPIGAAAPAILIPLWPPLRKRYIVPRAGLVEFSDERMSRMNTAVKGLIVLGAFTFCLGIAAFFVDFETGHPIAVLLQNSISAMPVLLLGLLMAIGGFFIGQIRGFVYAILFLLIGVVGALLAVHPGWMILTAGCLVAGSGALFLTRFMLAYPLPGSNASSEPSNVKS